MDMHYLGTKPSGSQIMATINVRQSTMVRPAEPTPRHRLWLSSIDLVVYRVHARSVYFYRPDGSPDFFDSTQLRDALARVLVPFYPVAGRKTKDEAGRMEIDCNDQGVLFIEVNSDATVDDFGDFAPTTQLKPLIPEVDCTNDSSSCPLLLLQVTYFKCGGVALGVSIDHQLVDGITALHFLNSWSDVVRGRDVKVAPVIDRTLLCARNPPTPRFPHVECEPPPPMNDDVSSVAASSDHDTSSTVKIFTLAPELLNRLIEKHSPPGAACSTFVVLAAHLWRCVSIARDLPPDQVTRLYIAVDGRRRLRPPLPEGYMGNVIFTATPTATAGEVTASTEEGRFQVTRRIREEIAKMDDEYLRSALDHLELQPDPNLDKFTRGPHQHRSPNFRLTSWAQMPFYDADFKWGRPVFLAPGCMSREGMAYLLGSPSQDGSLYLAICLNPQHMLKFQNLVYEVLP